MAKFMFLLRGDCNEGPKKSPEEMQQAMQAMGAWMEDGMKNGWLLDPGDGLISEARMVLPDNSVIDNQGPTVTDGPFAESKELVGGYCMVEAEDFDAAVALAQAMPASGNGIEVRRLAGHSMDG